MKFFDKEKISRLTDERFADFESLVINELDFDFSVVQNEIKTISEFEHYLKEPFLSHEEKIFYRGERNNNRDRPLIPTIFRNRRALFDSDEAIAEVNADFVFEHYKKSGDYLKLYEKITGTNGRDSMYRLCAFSQHYLDVSPFIDFSKSLYVALSFAIKNRDVFNEDIVIYTVKIRNEADCTKSEKTANRWVEDYNVCVFRRNEDYLKNIIFDKNKNIKNSITHFEKINAKAIKMSNSPAARLIDIPTNDLMMFQQGVFLLLTDFKLVFNSYPTKSIRDDFEVTKWVISKDICKDLKDMIEKEAPWYDYDCLLDVKKAFEKAEKFHI